MRKLRRGMQPLMLTLLRLTVGVIMVSHGGMKLINMDGWVQNVANLGIPAPEITAWLAVAAELLGGAGLLIGFLTPIAAIAVFLQMLIAIIAVHAGNGLFAQNNGFEYPLTLLMAAMLFFAYGAGPVSVDGLLMRAWHARGAAAEAQAERRTGQDRRSGRERRSGKDRRKPAPAGPTGPQPEPGMAS